MNDFKLTYKPFGEHSILIEWPAIITENILNNIVAYKYKIEKHKFKDEVYIKSAYNSLLISYPYIIDNFYDEILALKDLYFLEIKTKKREKQLWRIPVCYNAKFGLDLDTISKLKNISVGTIIKRHCSAIYNVYFIGFLPGFLYLGGLHETLKTPRKTSPRLQIEKGAVAIGGQQTGIYPNASPGGWNIIGNSPINFFDIEKTIPCFASIGDKIQFYEISLKEHKNIKILAKNKVYQMDCEVISG